MSRDRIVIIEQIINIDSHAKILADLFLYRDIRDKDAVDFFIGWNAAGARYRALFGFIFRTGINFPVAGLIADGEG